MLTSVKKRRNKFLFKILLNQKEASNVCVQKVFLNVSTFNVGEINHDGHFIY